MRRTGIVLLALLTFAPLQPARAVPPVVGGAFASDNVELVASFPDAPAIGGRMVGRYLYVSTLQGVRIYDTQLVPGERLPVLVGAFELPHWQNEDVDTNGEILLVSHDSLPGPSPVLYVFDVAIPHAPHVKGVLRLPPDTGHTVSCINDCTWAWVAGTKTIIVVDLRDPAAPKLAGQFTPGGGTVHDVQVDSAGIAWLSTANGIFGFTTKDPQDPAFYAGGSIPNDFIIHNSVRPKAHRWKARTSTDTSTTVRDGELLMVTEEDYLPLSNDQCQNDGQFITTWYRQIGGTRMVTVLDRWNLGRGTLPEARSEAVAFCSAHYFSERNEIVAAAWYEQGVRFLDVSNPRNIRQIGYYMPAVTETWNALWNGDYVYTFDGVRGLEVLRFNGSTASATVLAPRVNATLPGSQPDPRFGWACRLRV